MYIHLDFYFQHRLLLVYCIIMSCHTYTFHCAGDVCFLSRGTGWLCGKFWNLCQLQRTGLNSHKHFRIYCCFNVDILFLDCSTVSDYTNSKTVNVFTTTVMILKSVFSPSPTLLKQCHCSTFTSPCTHPCRFAGFSSSVLGVKNAHIGTRDSSHLRTPCYTPIAMSEWLS